MAALPFADGFFDLILTWNVIHHGTAAVIRQTLAEIERCLRPQGYLLCTLISTQHRHHGKGTEIELGTFVVPGETETGRCWPGSVRTDSRRTQSWLRAPDSGCGTRMPAATTAVTTAITAAARNTDS